MRRGLPKGIGCARGAKVSKASRRCPAATAQCGVSKGRPCYLTAALRWPYSMAHEHDNQSAALRRGGTRRSYQHRHDESHRQCRLARPRETAFTRPRGRRMHPRGDNAIIHAADVGEGEGEHQWGRRWQRAPPLLPTSPAGQTHARHQARRSNPNALSCIRTRARTHTHTHAHTHTPPWQTKPSPRPPRPRHPYSSQTHPPTRHRHRLQTDSLRRHHRHHRRRRRRRRLRPPRPCSELPTDQTNPRRHPRWGLGDVPGGAGGGAMGAPRGALPGPAMPHALRKGPRNRASPGAGALVVVEAARAVAPRPGFCSPLAWAPRLEFWRWARAAGRTMRPRPRPRP